MGSGDLILTGNLSPRRPEVFLWRVPIILTTNNWDLSVLKADEREWVEANCVAVSISEPVYDINKKECSAEKRRRAGVP